MSKPRREQERRAPNEPRFSLLETAMGQLTSRILGMNNLPAPVETVEAACLEYFADRAESIQRLNLPKPLRGILLKNVDMGLGIRTTAYVVGVAGGHTTSFIREGWYKCRILDGPDGMKSLLALVQGADVPGLVRTSVDVGRGMLKNLLPLDLLPHLPVGGE
ncbi:MAG: hypothetical protein KGJ23_08115 [Euryarchaeota archaeon]|nr:hypothetical protein [Euryarchaeota archaeon]MDE1836566.1 hypothetical protein [Euryarchaeota archaeon]MDE1879239.1 hypothetical protein [Euryarchaeota archaeon]MDE2044536.1 hypothetical protein [Thermoplasmata archaeon]